MIAKKLTKFFLENIESLHSGAHLINYTYHARLKLVSGCIAHGDKSIIVEARLGGGDMEFHSILVCGGE